MTDKELKKLSRLELLELLLMESRENEKLRGELEKIKKENTIERSAQHLNETSKQLDVALKQVSSIINTLDNGGVAKNVGSKKPQLADTLKSIVAKAGKKQGASKGKTSKSFPLSFRRNKP